MRSKKLLLLPLLLEATSCGRGYDLSYGEAVKAMSGINTEIAETVADSGYSVGSYSFRTDLASLEIDYSVSDMYFHMRMVNYEATPEGPSDSGDTQLETTEETLPYYLDEYWYYVDDGYGYELWRYGEGDYIDEALLHEGLTASAVYQAIRKKAANFRERVAAASSNVLNAMQLLETTAGSEYSFFMREEGALEGSFSYPVGSDDLSYEFSFAAYFPLSLRITFGDESSLETFSNGSYRKTFPDDLESFPIPEPTPEEPTETESEA